MSGLKLESAEPWAPHPRAAPRTSREGDGTFVIAANGTRSCCGGWQLHYAGAARSGSSGRAYRISCSVRHRDIEHPRDVLRGIAFWERLSPEQPAGGRQSGWDYLLPESRDDGTVRFSRILIEPDGSDDLTLRYVFRWSTKGSSEWSLPQIEAVSQPGRADQAVVPTAPEAPAPVKVAVATGNAPELRDRKIETVQDNVDYYSSLCERVCRAEKPDLILLPEVALQWRLPGHSFERAVPVPGPECDAFARIAREYHTRVALGVFELDGDAVRNTLALISPAGEVDGKYHKVHLATGESESGILAGGSFPVFDTEVGRLGCNICMDSSAAESSRMVGLNGAEFLLLSIMGDHRASRWSPGCPIFNEDRWKAIMRTRALDNQLCMVVARNEAQGSCVIDRKGDILAWNEGDRDYITAAVPRADGYRTWNHGCFRSVNWMQRRPHLYGAFVDERNVGSLVSD